MLLKVIFASLYLSTKQGVTSGWWVLLGPLDVNLLGTNQYSTHSWPQNLRLKVSGPRACSYLCYLEIGWDASPEEMLIFNESDGEDSFTQTTTSSLSYREAVQRQAGRNAAVYSLKAPTSWGSSSGATYNGTLVKGEGAQGVFHNTLFQH